MYDIVLLLSLRSCSRISYQKLSIFAKSTLSFDDIEEKRKKKLCWAGPYLYLDHQIHAFQIVKIYETT
jgi:hypothetical protein